MQQQHQRSAEGDGLKACPAKAQAACINPFGQKVTTYYYSRGPQALADTKKSCVAQQGKWVDNP